MEGLALWKSRANRNSHATACHSAPGLALWKSRANRNSRKNHVVPVNGLALWKSRANRNGYVCINTLKRWFSTLEKPSQPQL